MHDGTLICKRKKCHFNSERNHVPPETWRKGFCLYKGAIVDVFYVDEKGFFRCRMYRIYKEKVQGK